VSKRNGELENVFYGQVNLYEHTTSRFCSSNLARAPEYNLDDHERAREKLEVSWALLLKSYIGQDLVSFFILHSQGSDLTLVSSDRSKETSIAHYDLSEQQTLSNILASAVTKACQASLKCDRPNTAIFFAGSETLHNGDVSNPPGEDRNGFSEDDDQNGISEPHVCTLACG